MGGEGIDIRSLIHAVCYPQSNDEYVKDQKRLTDLFKEPGAFGRCRPVRWLSFLSSASGKFQKLINAAFFYALQEYAADHTLSQNERLFASVISGREMKTKWRSKM